MQIQPKSAIAVVLFLVDLVSATKRKEAPQSLDSRATIVRCNVQLIETDDLGYESLMEVKQISPSGTQTFQYGKDVIHVRVDGLCAAQEISGVRKDHTHLEIEVTFRDVDGGVKKIKNKY
ncbi:hypothetical protein PgNI_11270 [Pyricularia grisea]|uniref:Uncharacterized protein n=1 Tax=Pyricularia grisea TaxID=148305 RepID=A0A6P8APF5_PYRGI|nr:hypothetical protein PgNI_11270 [Pyricularia grisea]TLD03906.1 hypothetical protein PgNI_11270 [Pyricularia grisea]